MEPEEAPMVAGVILLLLPLLLTLLSVLLLLEEGSRVEGGEEKVMEAEGVWFGDGEGEVAEAAILESHFEGGVEGEV